MCVCVCVPTPSNKQEGIQGQIYADFNRLECSFPSLFTYS